MAQEKPKGKGAASGLGSLGKALLQAGILREDKAKEIAHEERVKKKELGPEGIEEEKRARDQAASAALESKREEARAAQSHHDDQLDQARVDRLIQEGTLTGLGRGKRFHFVSSYGRVPYVEVNEENQRLLVRGELGIVEVPGPGERPAHVVVQGRDRLEKLSRFAPDRLRFWNAAGGS